MKLLRWLSNLKIRHKLLLFFFVLPVVLMICVGYIAYHSSTDALRRQNYDNIYQYQQSTIAEISRNMNRYELISQTISSNATIQTLISPREIRPIDEYEMVRTVLNPTLHSFLDASEAGINIQLVRYNDYNSEIIAGNFENLLEHPRSTGIYVSAGRRQFQIVNYNRMKDLDWVKSAVQEPGTIGNGVWAQVGMDSEFGYISFLRKITDMSTPRNEVIGLLRLTIMFDTIYSEVMNGADGSFSLVFNNQHELLSAEPYKIDFYEMNEDAFGLLINNLNTGKQLADQDITLIKSNEFGDSWYIISAFPTGIITENVRRIATITVSTVAIAGVLLLLLTLKLSSSFSKRISAIATQMQHFSSGEPNVKITGLGQDEIGFLSNVFNDMSDQISTLIYDNYISDIEKKDALLKALQAQINPHILYNSLSFISRLAEVGETSEITNMVQALAKFYRLTLNRGNEFLSVEDELSQLKAYVEVFRIRKGETFDVAFDIDKKVLKYQTIKVILQPFVENIFEHAARPGDFVIKIHISIQSKGDDILFTIKDNGAGISTEKLSEILDEEVSQGYGIINVNNRLKLQYGPNYGITITSELGIGTDVNILIPKRSLSEK